MSQGPGMQMREGLPGEGSLGVMDALGMGWRLLKGDFWRLWLVVFVMGLIQVGLGLVNSIPYLGTCTSLATTIFVQAPLTAGLFFAIRRRIDGAAAEVGNLFAGFRLRYWQSVVANLIMIGIMLGMMVAFGLVAGLIVGVGAAITHGFKDPEPPIFLIVALLILGLPALVAMIVVGLHFLFTFLAVWDYDHSGWDAVKASARTVWANLGSVVGLQLLFFLVWLVAMIPLVAFGVLFAIGLDSHSDALAIAGGAGLFVCVIGYVFLIPTIVVWYKATLIYLYRSWTGQALVQPVVQASPAAGVPGGEGPIPPSDIQPPAGV